MTGRVSNMPSCKLKNRTSRTARILYLATNQNIKNGDSNNSYETKKRKRSCKESSSNSKGKHRYVELYDTGNWEELNKILLNGIEHMKQSTLKNSKREPWGEEYQNSSVKTSCIAPEGSSSMDVQLQRFASATNLTQSCAPQSFSTFEPKIHDTPISTENVKQDGDIDKRQIINKPLITAQDISTTPPPVRSKVAATNKFGFGIPDSVTVHPVNCVSDDDRSSTNDYNYENAKDIVKFDFVNKTWNPLSVEQEIFSKSKASNNIPEASKTNTSLNLSTDIRHIHSKNITMSPFNHELPVQNYFPINPVNDEEQLHTFDSNSRDTLTCNHQSINKANIQQAIAEECTSITSINNAICSNNDIHKTFTNLTSIFSNNFLDDPPTQNSFNSFTDSLNSLADDKIYSTIDRELPVNDNIVGNKHMRNQVQLDTNNSGCDTEITKFQSIYKPNIHQAIDKETAAHSLEVNEKSSNIALDTKPNKRIRRCDRRNFCLFCNTLVLNFRRHLINNHNREIIVAEYIALFKYCKDESKIKRAKIIEDLTLRGNHIYNEMLLTNANEEISVKDLLPVKRPPKDKDIKSSHYVTCTICFGLFVRKHYYEHASTCKKKFDEINVEEKKSETVEDMCHNENLVEKNKTYYLKMYAKTFCKKSNSVLKEMEQNIYPVLRQDDLGIKAMEDSLLVSLVSDFYTSHSDFKDRTQVTRKLRDGARLVEKVRSMDPEIKVFSDLFQPSKVNVVIEACKSLCNLDKEQSSNKPAIVGMNGRLSWILEEGCKKFIDDIICSDNLTQERKQVKKREVKYFHECLRRRWKYAISTNLEKKRRRKIITKDLVMPLDEDIKMFVSMLRDMEKVYQEKLENDMPKITKKDYETLCQITICHILTLNRRRPFEATHSEIEFYLKKISSNDDYPKDVMNTLADEERISLNELSSYIVPAKGVEAIATILLTKQMEKSIEIIIKARKVFNMTDSIYLFPRPGLKTPFDGSKVLRDMKSLCRGLKNPKHLTATGLRHHVATVGHVKGPAFTSKLSQFMCHTQSVHDKNYVSPINVIHKGVIGNYLTSLEGTTFDNVENNLSIKNIESNEIKIQNSSAEIVQSETNTRVPRSAYSDYSIGTSTDDEEVIPKQNDKRVINKQTREKRRWTKEEKSAVINHFSKFIQTGTNPGICKSRELIKTSGTLLKSRTPQQINTFIDNINKGKLKLPSNFKHLKKN